MNIELGQRTEETVAVYFERAQNAAIRAVLPQRARTLEEALADYRRTLEPGASSGRAVRGGRVVLRHEPVRRSPGHGELLRL